ncbi:hypothetical protein FRC05_004433 [Tulasnella sp. 425]|nr:hypothetical protein FRC05_004433 [Tulasnella sp. 425]
MCWRPATGGFLTTLTATIILIVVCFNVPYFKTIYFLRATYNSNGQGGYISLGTLGYCLSVNGNETCTKPSIGYEFNPNTLFGNDTKIQIPTVVAKWLTYALFLHVIALALAGVSAIFGLLAHIREFSMTCFSSCISGAAAAICLIAFIFDLVLFFVAKARIQSIDGATAVIGNAIWLTLAAWILLFISGCAFGLGRCCIARRPRAPAASKASAYAPNGNATLPPDPNAAYAEQMRMDAIKAEMDRKALQKSGTTHEVGLPAFDSYEEYETRPLTGDDTPAHSPYRDQPSPAPNRYGAAGAATGYVPASSLQTPPRRQASAASTATHNNGGRSPPPAGYGNSYGHGGRRTTDHGSTYPPTTTYPPQQNLSSTNYNPARESSLAERDIYATAGLAAPAAATAAAVGVGAAAATSRNDYLQPNTAQHGRGDTYGHHSQDSSYHSAYSHQPYGSHYQDPSTAASQYNYGASNQPYDQAAAYGQAQHSRSPALPGGYPAGGHSQYPSQQSTYPPQNYSQQQSYTPQPSQNAYDPYSDSYNHPGTTPTPGAYPPQQSYTPQPQPQTPYSPQHQSSYPLPSQPMVGGSNAQPDLNFPGVAVPSPQRQPATYASSPEPINTQLPYGAQAAGSSAAAWQEESEPSTVGPSAGRPNIPEDAPPDYETSTVGSRNTPYQNEKQTYRPQ